MVAVPGAGTEVFFWLSSAVVGLVTLRKGSQHGLFIGLWAILPAMVLAWLKFPSALMCLLTCFVMAAVLRLTQQWPVALIAGAATSLLMAVILQFGFSPYLQSILDIIKPVLEQMFAESAQSEVLNEMFAKFGTQELAGSYAVGASAFAVISLALARYWQAELYNPDGFGEEFRGLRFKAPIAFGLLILALILFSAEGYKLWSWICLLPLVVAGLGLLHWLVRQSGGSSMMIGLLYASLLIFDPVKQLVCALALADSVVNIRRLRSSPAE